MAKFARPGRIDAARVYNEKQARANALPNAKGALSMNSPQKILWSLIASFSPHYLQYADPYHEVRLTQQLSDFFPFGWGLCSMVVDQDVLTNGEFTLVELRGTMPDRLNVRIPEQDLSPLTRNFGDFPLDTEHPLDVFLTIPIERIGLSKCELENKTQSDRPRYVGSPLRLPDYNIGENPQDVLVARKNFSISFSAEALPDYSIIKIAQLVRQSDGLMALQDSYIPPLLWISGSDTLMKLLHGLIERLAEIGKALADQQRGDRADRGADLSRFLLQDAIHSTIPVLTHYYDVGRIHPEVLFIELARLAGKFTLVNPESSPSDLPKYQHSDLQHTFLELDRHFRSILDNMILN